MTHRYRSSIWAVCLAVGSVFSVTFWHYAYGRFSDAALPVSVTEDFHFTVTADPRDEVARWNRVMAAIVSNVGDEGAFHISPGDIDPLQPIRDGIDTNLGSSAIWYPGVGNHEKETGADMTWIRNEYNNGNGVRTPLKDFTNQDGPSSSKETTYSWDHGNAHFIMLNQYWDGTSDIGTDGDIVQALYDWLAADLDANTQPVVFVFGHEPAFPFHRHVGDSLDKYPARRDAFWNLLETKGVYAFFCGHTHVYSKYQNSVDGVWQVDVGNAGNDSSSAPDTQTFANVIVTATSVQYDIWKSTTMGGPTFTLSDTWTEPIGPKIVLDPVAIDRTVGQGSNLPNDSFTVGAIRPGTVNYTIDDDDVDWLSISPDSGDVTSTEDPDTINVIYSVSGLSVGPQQATITVSSSDAVNSPKTVIVTVTVEGPSIAVNPSQINRTVFLGDDLADDLDVFTVANDGGGTLNYTLEDDADWLTISPESGDSTGEADPIDLSYPTVADLPVGLHTAVITVSSVEPGIPSKTVTVNVTVETVSPDFDGDGDVDLDDFGHLQACLSGANVSQEAPECLDAHLQGDDDDVDAGDLQFLLGCMSGKNVPADPACDD